MSNEINSTDTRPADPYDALAIQFTKVRDRLNELGYNMMYGGQADVSTIPATANHLRVVYQYRHPGTEDRVNVVVRVNRYFRVLEMEVWTPAANVDDFMSNLAIYHRAKADELRTKYKQ